MLGFFFCVGRELYVFFFFFQAEDGIRDYKVTGVQTCALPIFAAPETMKALPFCLVTSLTASATEEVGTSKIASTLSTSYHWRAMLEPTSGLFWWSAEMISTFIPFLAAPKSSTAMRAATTEPGPAMSAYRLDMSLSTPILITPSDTWAWAPLAANARATAAVMLRKADIDFSFVSWESDQTPR